MIALPVLFYLPKAGLLLLPLEAAFIRQMLPFLRESQKPQGWQQH